MTNIFGSITTDNAFRGDLDTSLRQKLGGSSPTEGSIFTRVLGCLAATAVLVVSILGHFLFAEEVRTPLTTMLCVLYLVIGIILVLVEFMPNSSLAGSVFEEVQFLRHLLGKSVCYLFLGLLFICQGAVSDQADKQVSSWMFISVGIYSVVVAIIFFLLGWRLRGSSY